MPLFGPHRVFEIPGTPGFNPQAEDPRLRPRSVYASPADRAQVPPLREVARPPQVATSSTLDRVTGGQGGMPDLRALPDRYPILTRMEKHYENEPTREKYRPSTGRTVGAAAIGAIKSYLNPGQGVGAEAMTNIMDAPFNKAHGEWKQRAAKMQAAHELNKIRRGYERADETSRLESERAQREQSEFQLKQAKADREEEEFNMRRQGKVPEWANSGLQIRSQIFRGSFG